MVALAFFIPQIASDNPASNKYLPDWNHPDRSIDIALATSQDKTR